jgi:uncharacterized protein
VPYKEKQVKSPAILFEILALNREALAAFYTNVFDWPTREETGSAFIHFPPEPRQVMGIIANAEPGKPGWSKGVTFYIHVERIEVTFEKIKAHGGVIIVEPIEVEQEGFRFAMFEDPECNVIGLIELKSQNQAT